MPIWVDADACPRPVKEILFSAADRTGVLLTLVANHAMALPKRPNVRMLQVAGGFDVADDEITKRDFMDTMRSSGAVSGGPPAYSAADRQAFASELDRWLARHAG